ncbi:MAG: T9SS type A sorting domain-containing protein [Bacteroidetes bacterium]|nr:T9SS type A sorting domain-containing protein [Bacteroidota bacterium]
MKKQLLNLKIAAIAVGIFFTTTASAAFTAVTSGNWSSATTWGGIAPTATVLNQDITIPSGITVTLDADVTFTGLLNSFAVNGTLSNTSSNGITITQGALSGNGTISVNRLSFTTLGTSSFSGNLNLKRLINSTTILAFTAIANVADTLELEGGNILLNTNANLTMQSNSTIKINNGSITIGGGIFNTNNAYNVMYVGTSKTTGIELNTSTLQHVYLQMNNNNQTVTLNNNMIVNGNLNSNSGKLTLNGKQLTLKGNLTMGGGSIINSDASAMMTIEGSGSLNSMLMFDAGSIINSLTINRSTSGQVKLGSAITIDGHLNLMDGNFSIEGGGLAVVASGSTVHVEKGSVTLNTGTFNGTASYNVEYMGSTNANTGIEFIGSGLNNVWVNYTNTSNKVTLSNPANISGNLNMSKGKIDLNGKNIFLNGTISSSPNAMFVGNSISEMHLNLTATTNDTIYFDNASTNSQTLYKLRLNIGGANPMIHLGSKLIIDSELNFVKGQVALSSNNDLEIGAAAAIVGFDDTKYVVTSGNTNGALVMKVNAGSAYVTFPVGTNSNYSPAFVQQASAATSGNFNVRAMNTVLSGGTYGPVNSNTLKVVNRTWFVNSGVATINANLKFGWVAAAEVNGFDRTNAYVSHYTSNAWDVISGSSATVSANNTYELSRTGVTSLSPFAVTEVGEPLKIKELSNLTGIELYPNPSKDFVTIKMANSTDDFTYELTDITGRTILTTSNANSLNKFDVSNLKTGYYFIKITNTNDNKTITKRFVKE